MKFWAILGEGAERHELDLEVQLEDGMLVLETENERVRADVAPLPDGESYSLLVNGRSDEVAIEVEGDELQVELDGRRFRVAVKSPIEKTLREVVAGPAVSAGAVLRAPMPGLIVEVKVAEGDSVSAGQSLAIIEAMKMQNELVAESAGIVRTVHTGKGESVEAGRELITLDPPGASS